MVKLSGRAGQTRTSHPAPVVVADRYRYEEELRQSGFSLVAGVDEAGRGACAGPLVAAACILPPREVYECVGVDDSKKLTPKRRQAAYDDIMANAVAVAWVRIEADECDQFGIQEANIQALRRAVLRLDPQPDYVLSDGFAVTGLPMPSLPMIKGDQLCACISAASIIAKVTRDEIMTNYDREYPRYGFAVHKGYATSAHQAALDEFGPSQIHRLTYANVARTRIR